MHQWDKYQHFRHYEHFDIRKRVSKISDEKEFASLWSANKTIKKQKEEFNGILNASVRTKMLSSDKVMRHDEMHWLKTLFSHICDSLLKAVASDQHNYAKNIKMVKGVHQLTLRPNMLISVIDQFAIFNGWMNGQSGVPGVDPDSHNTGSAHGTNTIVCMYTHTIHTYTHVQTGI